MVDWVQVLIGFAGGSVASTLINGSWTWWRRPIITALLIPNVGCYVETSRGDPPNHRTAKFLRLQVGNKGLSSLKGCSGYVTRIITRQNGQTTNDEREILELKWSHQGAVFRDIPRGGFFYVDIAALDRVALANNRLSLGAELPFSLVGLLSKRASYELSVLVAADNARAVARTVEFEFDPASTELTFRYDENWLTRIRRRLLGK
jgi:hypothetical protein